MGSRGSAISRWSATAPRRSGTRFTACSATSACSPTCCAAACHSELIRSLLRWLIAGAALGLAVPVVLQLLARALDNLEAVPSALLSAFDYVQLMFWPTPMIMLPADEPGSPDLNSFGPFTLATLGNAGLYAVLAGLTWLGVKRSRWFLLLPAAVVAGLWCVVWST